MKERIFLFLDDTLGTNEILGFLSGAAQQGWCLLVSRWVRQYICVWQLYVSDYYLQL